MCGEIIRKKNTCRQHGIGPSEASFTDSVCQSTNKESSTVRTSLEKMDHHYIYHRANTPTQELVCVCVRVFVCERECAVMPCI